LTSEQRVTIDLTRNQVKEAPEYKEGRPVVVIGAAAPSSGSEMPEQ
jgi:hypothetical protein